MANYAEVYVFTKPKLIEFFDKIIATDTLPSVKLHDILELGDIATKFYTTAYMEEGSVIVKRTYHDM